MLSGYSGGVVQFGSYTLLERLGQGGMSRVDLARRTIEEARWVRLVAIKRIQNDAAGVDPAMVRMFCDEARIGAELQHANVAPIYDFGREGGELFLVMEYVAGLDLRVLLGTLQARGARMPLRIALSILVGVLGGLGHAHGRRDPLGHPLGIVHRDVNPRNVMVSLRGEVKLIDFGVALATDRLEQTEAGKVKGKFTYMAPEQLGARGGVDGRADLFAVGLMLTEMGNGRSPFSGLTEVQAVHRILAGKIPAIEADLTGLAAVQRRALATDPADRYPDAETFAADLRAVLAPIGGVATEPELAAWLRDVDPDGVAAVEARVRACRAGGPDPGEAPARPPPEVTKKLAPVPSPDAVPLDRVGPLSWWVVPVAAGTTLIVGMVLGVTAWVWWAGRHPAPEADPAPVVTLAQPTARKDPDAPGTVTIYTEPDGLDVLVDGVHVGTSPLLDVPAHPGPHTVLVRDRRGHTAEQSVDVPAGSWTTVTLSLH